MRRCVPVVVCLLVTDACSALEVATCRSALDAVYPATSYQSRRMIARDAALRHSARDGRGGGRVSTAVADPVDDEPWHATSRSTSAAVIPLAGDGLVYGEFDLAFFAKLLEAASPQSGESFIDCGSGVGRLVCGAALLRPSLARSSGIELLPELHDAAISALARLSGVAASPSSPLADCHIERQCQFSCCDLFGEEARAQLSAADIVFCYPVTWERDAHNRLTGLSTLFADRLHDGARVLIAGGVSLLPRVGATSFERVATLHQENAETGAQSAAHVYRVERR